jgi:hypothetical protein
MTMTDQDGDTAPKRVFGGPVDPRIVILRNAITLIEGDLRSEAAFDEFVWRLYCACAAVWPEPADARGGDAEETPTDESEPDEPAEGQETNRDKILRLSREGLSIAEVMEKTGLARSTVINVRTALRKAGLLK